VDFFGLLFKPGAFTFDPQHISTVHIYMKRILLSLTVLASASVALAQNPYPILPIDSVQFVNQQKLQNPTANTLPDYIDPVKKNPTFGDTVRFIGIPVSHPGTYGLSQGRKAAYIQRKGGGPWSGVQVMAEPNGSGASNLADLKSQTKFYSDWKIGFPVLVTGVIRDYQGETQINMIANNPDFDNSLELQSINPDTLVSTVITARDLMAGNPNSGWVQQKHTAERWEGVHVTIRNVSVYSIQNSGARRFWSVIDDFGNVIDVRDFSAYYRGDDNEDTTSLITGQYEPPAVGTRLEYIRGVVTEYAVSGVSRYGIAPLAPGDVRICSSCPPIIRYINRTPIIATPSDTINIIVSIAVGDTTLMGGRLYYQYGSGLIDSSDLVPVLGFPNYYLGRINPAGSQTVVRWWAGALDNKGRAAIYPDPFTLGNSIYVVNGVNDIATLQFSNVPSGATIWNGDSLANIDVRGVVTGNTFVAGSTSLLTVQAGQGPNSAIYIQRGTNDSASAWQVGDSVQITSAIVRENFNVTTLYGVLGNVISSGNALPAFEVDLPVDSFINNRVAYARPWEGVLVRFNNVYVSDVNPDGSTVSYEWSVNPDSTATVGLRIDDMSSVIHPLKNMVRKGMKLDFVQGPMYFSFSNFKVIPRSLSDLDLSHLDSINPVITLVGPQYDTIDMGQSYVDPGATAMDDMDGDITSRIVRTGLVDSSVTGDYVLTYKVEDLFGNMDSVQRFVHVRMFIGSKENVLSAARVSLYPNPAVSDLTVSAYGVTGTLNVTITDLVGRTKQVAKMEGNTASTIHISDLANGAYFCTISNGKSSRTVKFMVTGK
jgi:hypothetical protein